MANRIIEIKEFDSKWRDVYFDTKDARDKFYIAILTASSNWKENLRLKEEPFMVKKKGNMELMMKSIGVTGVMSVEDIEIQIIPKFLNQNSQDWKTAFINILEYTQNNGRYLISNVEHGSSNLSLYNYLADVFLIESRKIQNGGLPRQYENVESNLSYYKGKYDYKKISYQILHTNKLPLRFTEYTEDTPISRTIKVAMEILSELVSGGNRRKKLFILASTIDAQSKKPTKYELKNMTLPPSYSELQVLLSLSKMIIERESLSINNGSYQGKGFLWPTAPIFESFLKTIIKSICRDKGWNFSDSGLQYIESTTEIELSLKQKKVFPDIQIYNADKKLIYLLDAKYKVWDGTPKRSDIYQMITYAANSQIDTVTLLYPVNQNSFNKAINLLNIDYPSKLNCFFVNIMQMKNGDGFKKIKADFDQLLS